MQNRPATAKVLDLENFLPYRLNRAAEGISRRFAKRYRERYGLTRPEWRALATVGQFGSITATAIGAVTSQHKTMVSRAVSGLENRRWLQRKPDERDRRVEHLRLTASGRTAYEELVIIARQFEDELAKRLGKQAVAQISSALEAIESIYPKPRPTRRP